MNSTTVAILAALVLALGYLYLENSEAQLPRDNNNALGEHSMPATAPNYQHRAEPTQRLVEPSQSSSIDACMVKENVNFDFINFVKQEIRTSNEEIQSFYVPEKLAACGLATGNGRALGSKVAFSVASGKLMAILEQSITGGTTNTLGGNNSSASFALKSELVEILARGLLPIHNAYDPGSDTYCTCVAKRFVATDSDSSVSPISTSSNNGSAGASLPPALSQNAAPAIAPPSYGSSAVSPPAPDHSEHFDSIVIETSTLPTGDVKVLTEHAGVYREVLNIESYNVNVAFFDFDFSALLKRWQSERPYTLRALKTLDENSVVISEADARALAPILHLATDEARLVFRAR